MSKEANVDDDELRSILGDETYDELERVVQKFDPSRLTDEQLAQIQSGTYTITYPITGEDALDLILTFYCSLKNACIDCGSDLLAFLKEIITELNYTLLESVDDE